MKGKLLVSSQHTLCLHEGFSHELRLAVVTHCRMQDRRKNHLRLPCTTTVVETLVYRSASSDNRYNSKHVKHEIVGRHLQLPTLSKVHHHLLATRSSREGELPLINHTSRLHSAVISEQANTYSTRTATSTSGHF